MSVEPSSGQAGSATIFGSKATSASPAEMPRGLKLIQGFARRYGRWLVVGTLLFGGLASGSQKILIGPLFEATAIVAIISAPQFGSLHGTSTDLS